MSRIKKLNICPRCHSSNYYISNTDGLITGHTGAYLCNSCGFEGVIFPQISLNEISKFKKINQIGIAQKINTSRKSDKINLSKLFIVLLFIFLIYSSYRFGLFDFAQPSHEHAVNFFSKYIHLE